MAEQTQANLQSRANEISNETTAGANTKVRVGGILLDIVDTLFGKISLLATPPTYTAPTLALTESQTNNVEAGTNITPALTPVFTQNDGGALSEVRIYKGGVLARTQANQAQWSDTQFQIGDQSVTYNAQADYAQGPVKNDDLGNPYPTGRIEAGTVTSGNVTYSGQRNRFSGAVANKNTIDSAYIRALPSSGLNPANGTTFTISIPAGTQRVIFAYPATLRDVSSVKYVEGLNAEVKGIFTQSTVSVAGANAFTSINYKVYVYEPASAFSEEATYTVTI